MKGPRTSQSQARTGHQASIERWPGTPAAATLWLPKTPSDLKTWGPIIREMMVDTTMSSLFVAFFALVASSFRTRDALQAEILPLRHQLHHLRKFGLGYEQPSLS